MTHTPSNPPRNNTGRPYNRVFEIGMSYGVPVYTLGWRMGSSFVPFLTFPKLSEFAGDLVEWLRTGTLKNVR